MPEGLASWGFSCHNARWNLPQGVILFVELNWWIIGATAVAGLGLGTLVLMQTKWFKVRKYAIDAKRTFDRHKSIQEKTETLQALGQQANPVIMKKHLRELIDAQKALIADMEKLKVPPVARELHDDQVAMQRESMEFYQMMMAGKLNQKTAEGRQKKLMKMQDALQEKMEKVYGPMKKPK